MTPPVDAPADLIVAATSLVLVWAAVGDLLTYRIPNLIPILVALGFCALAWFEPPTFLIGGALTGLAVFAAGLLMHARRLVGGGDAKLLSAVALWCGPGQLAEFALVIAAATVTLALFMLSPAGRLMPPAPGRLAPTYGRGRGAMPFGVAIVAGGLWVAARDLLTLP